MCCPHAFLLLKRIRIGRRLHQSFQKGYVMPVVSRMLDTKTFDLPQIHVFDDIDLSSPNSMHPFSSDEVASTSPVKARKNVDLVQNVCDDSQEWDSASTDSESSSGSSSSVASSVEVLQWALSKGPKGHLHVCSGEQGG
eukprot:8432817-Karenia_brevis.AAC.1